MVPNENWLEFNLLESVQRHEPVISPTALCHSLRPDYTELSSQIYTLALLRSSHLPRYRSVSKFPNASFQMASITSCFKPIENFFFKCGNRTRGKRDREHLCYQLSKARFTKPSFSHRTADRQPQQEAGKNILV